MSLEWKHYICFFQLPAFVYVGGRYISSHEDEFWRVIRSAKTLGMDMGPIHAITQGQLDSLHSRRGPDPILGQNRSASPACCKKKNARPFPSVTRGKQASTHRRRHPHLDSDCSHGIHHLRPDSHNLHFHLRNSSLRVVTPNSRSNHVY